MILNVGSGEIHHPSAVNIDLRPVADLQADCRALPFPDGSAELLIAEDVLEHLEDPADALLEWHRVLEPEGRLILRVPNLLAIAHQLTYWGQHPGPQLDALLANVYGGHKWGQFDTHHTGFTPASMSVTLSNVGFTVTDNDLALNMTVAALKET